MGAGPGLHTGRSARCAQPRPTLHRDVHAPPAHSPPGTQPPRSHTHSGHNRPATSVCQPSCNRSGLGPTEPCTGFHRFLLGSGCGWGEYYWAAHSTGLMPNETQILCRMLVACLGPKHQSEG